MSVEVPRTIDTRQVIDLFMSRYEDAQLLAKRESNLPSDARDLSFETILETFTPRQREVIETAYQYGYFDSPRRASGKELAEELGFSNTTFHEHVRKVENTLFEELLGDGGGSLVATDSGKSG
jgi:predicted DNA binding protein